MTSSTAAASAAERTLALIAVCLAAIAMPLTFSGTAVALPAIGNALGGSPVTLNWVTNAFMLTLGSFLLAAGALADGLGRKRVFLAGVGMFALLSVALAFAPGIVWLDFLRAAQGIAAAAALSAGMAALAQEFDGKARLRAFSLVGTSFGIGLAFGPVVSGLMVIAFGWRSIFLLVAAVAGLAFVLGAFALRESRDPDAAHLDWPGAITFTAALTLFTFGMLQAPEIGWGAPVVVALLAGAGLVMAAFVVIERRVAQPMLDLSLFRYPRFVGVQLLAAAPAYGFVVLLILLPVRFVGIEGMGEIEAGRMMIALSSPLLVLPLLAGQLTRWLAPATICGVGLAVSAAGLFWLTRIAVGDAAVVAPMLTIGLGIGLPWGLMDGLAVSVVPKERAGMASGIFNTIRVAGEGVALAIVSATLSGLTAAGLGGAQGAAGAQKIVTGDLAGAALALPGVSHAALVQAYGEAFSTLLLMLTGVTAVTALVVFMFLGRGARHEELSAEASGETMPAAVTRSGRA